jgi:hypothetical protein
MAMSTSPARALAARPLALALAAGLLTGGTGDPAAAQRERPAEVAATTAVVARASLATTRAWLSVRRTSRIDGVAQVHLSVLRHGSWQSAGSLRVSGVFWFVATGPGALCTWSVGESANTGQPSPTVASRRTIAVQLLLSPSLGCGPTHYFHEEHGALVRGR